MTDNGRVYKFNTMETEKHEFLFDEICNKLNELSHRENSLAPPSQKIEQMQLQIKRFRDDLQMSHEELRDKIQSIESVQFSQSDMSSQLKQLTEQLQNERMLNTKLNSDLATSLELSLQLQLEIQSLKARNAQIQNEEKKYTQALQDKWRIALRDLEISTSLKAEGLQQQVTHEQSQKEDLLKANQNLLDSLSLKETAITEHTQEIEKLSQALTAIETTAHEQTEVLKNLMEVTESKIIEMKLALDKRTLECQDYYNHLQQALTQANLHRHENLQLKDYINKVSQYFQSQNDTSAKV